MTPTSINLDNFNILENLSGSHAANISGIDPHDDLLSFSVLPIKDGEMFEVDGTILKFKEGISVDYEQSQFLQLSLEQQIQVHYQLIKV